LIFFFISSSFLHVTLTFLPANVKIEKRKMNKTNDMEVKLWQLVAQHGLPWVFEKFGPTALLRWRSEDDMTERVYAGRIRPRQVSDSSLTP
jgi:hypothetical protein